MLEIVSNLLSFEKDGFKKHRDGLYEQKSFEEATFIKIIVSSSVFLKVKCSEFEYFYLDQA